MEIYIYIYFKKFVIFVCISVGLEVIEGRGNWLVYHDTLTRV